MSLVEDRGLPNTEHGGKGRSLFNIAQNCCFFLGGGGAAGRGGGGAGGGRRGVGRRRERGWAGVKWRPKADG